MSRTLPAALEAVNNGVYQAVFRFKFYAAKGGGTIFNHADILTFRIANLEIEVEVVTASGAAVIEQYIQLLRGAVINGVEYLVGTSYYKVYETHQNNATGTFTIKASLIPKIRVSLAGDDTYQNVITAFCTACGLTASFKNPGAAVWGYQFLPAGKLVLLNDARQFLHLLRQKYLITASDQEGDVLQFAAFSASSIDQFTRDAEFEDRPFFDYPLTATTIDNEVQFVWKDEANTVHYSGTATKKLHNLGYLESTDSPPDINTMYIYGYRNTQIDLRLTTNDIIGENWSTLNSEYSSKSPYIITEIFNRSHEPSWYMNIEALNPFQTTEGGIRPPDPKKGTKGEFSWDKEKGRSWEDEGEKGRSWETEGNYTPLHTGTFKAKLSAFDSNIQTAMETLDSHTHINQTTEEIQDIVGAMFSGNTETGITATYDDSDGTIDLVVATPTATDIGAIPIDGWIAIATTWTRTGNHTFTMSGDLTTYYRKGTKIRYKDGGNYEYGVVASSSFASSTTTVTLITNTDYAMAAATITDKYISYIENPEAFPSFFNYTTVVTPAAGAITSYTVQQATWTTWATKIKFDVTYTLTNIGTGTGTSRFSTPVNATALFFGFGRENAVTGNMLQATWSSGTSIVSALTYNNGAVLTNNYQAIISIIGAF